MVPATDGKALDPHDIYRRLGEAGVTFGIDEDAVSAACARGVAERVLVAVGLPVEPGVKHAQPSGTVDCRCA